jgi:Protein of unknown function (DUF3224)
MSRLGEERTLKISATFEIKDWNERPFDEMVGVAKLTTASVAKEYAGDVEGTSATEWLMAYHPDKSAAFVGLERIKGTIGGLHGSLVLQHVGTFADGAAKATLTVVSGTDELRNATGGGELVADPGGRISLSVDA